MFLASGSPHETFEKYRTVKFFNPGEKGNKTTT